MTGFDLYLFIFVHLLVFTILQKSYMSDFHKIWGTGGQEKDVIFFGENLVRGMEPKISDFDS